MVYVDELLQCVSFLISDSNNPKTALTVEELYQPNAYFCIRKSRTRVLWVISSILNTGINLLFMSAYVDYSTVLFKYS